MIKTGQTVYFTNGWDKNNIPQYGQGIVKDINGWMVTLESDDIAIKTVSLHALKLKKPKI